MGRESGGAGARAGLAAALTGGPAWTERGRGEGARVGWAGWAKRPRGAGGMGHFVFFFYSSNCFPFSFYLLYLIQFQICHKFKLAPSSIMHQTKLKFRV
jgi:hypothetical protein